MQSAIMYQQPYVLKDEAGNGIIGVTGHSMGGFSTAMALYLDENDFAETGVASCIAACPKAQTLCTPACWVSTLK